MSRPRRSVKKTTVIESSSEDEIPAKKSKLSPVDKSKPTKEKNNDSSSSESDIENYLQPVDKLDFSSEFFNLKKDNDQEFDKIEKNIFDGVGVTKLSDSESDLDETSEKHHVEETVQVPKLNFQQLEDFTRKIEEAKIHVDKYNAQKKIKEKNVDISNMLAQGESKQLTLDNIKAEDLHSSDFQTTDDEDWEEVKTKDQEEKPLIPKKNIEIRIGEMPDHCRKKKGIDLLAAMKRRLNRIRKENQIYVHKVHILCWIAHGNFVNSVINNSEILDVALSLLPSDKCYPSDRIDLSYLEQIVQWYKRSIRLTDKAPPQEITLINALKLQIKKKEVYDKKMFVFIFIAILRALGVQCRMVLSFQVESLRPPSSELHSLSCKEMNKKAPKNKSEQLNKSQNKSVKTEANKVTDSKLGIGKKSAKTSAGTTVQKSIKDKENSHLKSNEIAKNKDKSSDIKNDVNPTDKLNFQKLKGIKKNSNNAAAENDVNKRQRGMVKEKTESDKPESNRRSSRKKVGVGKVAKNTGTESNITHKTSTKSKSSSTRDVTKTELHKDTKKSAKVDDLKNKKFERNIKGQDSLSIEEDKKSRSKSSSDAGKKSQELKSSRSKSRRSVSETPLLNSRSKRSKEKEVPQLDGANDEVKSKKVTKSKKLNLKKLNQPIEKTCPIKKHPSRLKASINNDDSENEFSPSPLKTAPEKRLNFSKLSQQPSTSRFGNQLDIRNDIIGLVKARIVEQKYADKKKMVQKRKQSFDSDSDSDYMPEPIKKKEHDSDSDIEYFVPKPKVKKRVSVKRLGPGHPILSDSDDEHTKKKKKGNNVWLEVFLENEEKWITADVIRGKVHCVNELYMRASHPVSYLVAWNNDNTIKDVTMRYCKNFNTVTRKVRIDSKWWEESLQPFKEKNTARSKEEDNDLNRQQLDQPLPKIISEYKNHPLYAIRRHLLKFEAMYPSEMVPLGYVRSEPVYPRNCVYVCKSREIWLKEAKVVKPGEKPYKIVKARPKYDRLSNTMITDQLLEIFGEWQTTDYDPPTAENGIVPRNAFGNVELFKECMLPKGTVHLKMPGLNRVCKKLNIDCASAIVGFDFHGGWSHPVYDGFVVCEEYTDTCIAAWEMEQEEIEKREKEKIDKRVYTNWKKLIKGLLIRERLKARYDFGGESSSSGKGKKKPKVAAKKDRIPSDSD